MITPKYSLNFLSGSLDPAITFSRAGNTATVTNADGSISLVNADTPRFNYSNGVLRGLLIEETRQNLLINSAMSGAVAGAPGTQPTGWSNGSTTGEISSVDAASYSSGNKLTFSVNTTRRAIFRQIAVSANTTYAFSVDYSSLSVVTQVQQMIAVTVLPAGASIVGYLLNGQAATATTLVQPGSGKLAIIVSIGATTGSPAFQIGIGLSSNLSTRSVGMSNPQVEVGAFPTSYIPTTTSGTVTRNADVATITGANFSGFWNAGVGGTTVTALPSTVSGTRPLVQFDDGTANEIIALRGNTTNPELYIVDGGAPQAQIDAGTIAANTSYTLTGWWQTNFCAARLSNGARVEDLTATIPTVTQMRIGSDGTNYLNGTIATIYYYDRFTSQIYNRRKNKVIFSVL